MIVTAKLVLTEIGQIGRRTNSVGEIYKTCLCLFENIDGQNGQTHQYAFNVNSNSCDLSTLIEGAVCELTLKIVSIIHNHQGSLLPRQSVYVNKLIMLP